MRPQGSTRRYYRARPSFWKRPIELELCLPARFRFGSKGDLAGLPGRRLVSPQKQTSAAVAATSALGQERTSAKAGAMSVSSQKVALGVTPNIILLARARERPSP